VRIASEEGADGELNGHELHTTVTYVDEDETDGEEE
jgi:hypothetical protein